jgi:hypothetical protein
MANLFSVSLRKYRQLRAAALVVRLNIANQQVKIVVS